MVKAVVPGTPAMGAGLRAGDIITSVGGRTVHRGMELAENTMRAKRSGTTSFTVNRDGVTRDVDVRLVGVRLPQLLLSRSEV